MTDFTFYFGAASGSSRKALQMMKEPNVMISFATQNNTPWYGIDSLFVDCGGYSMMQTQDGEHGPVGEYVEYLRRHEPELYALRDYPCEPDLLDDLDRTVEDHQRRTIEDSLEILQAVGDLDSQPVTVIQGWEPRDYESHIDDCEEAGLPLDVVGIGSVCRRHAATDIRRVITTVRDRLPDAHLHAFGVKQSVLKFPTVVDALDSADSLAYDYRADQLSDSKTWQDTAVAYREMKQRIEKETKRSDRRQQTLEESIA